MANLPLLGKRHGKEASLVGEATRQVCTSPNTDSLAKVLLGKEILVKLKLLFKNLLLAL